MSTFAAADIAEMLSLNQVGSEAIVPTTATASSVKVKPQAGGSTSKLEKVKVEPGSVPDPSTAGVVKAPGSSAETGPQWAHPDGKPAPPEFEEQLALWARQCSEFRRRATWMPTRPAISRKSWGWAL